MAGKFPGSSRKKPINHNPRRNADSEYIVPKPAKMQPAVCIAPKTSHALLLTAILCTSSQPLQTGVITSVRFHSPFSVSMSDIEIYQQPHVNDLT
jgi:hypothetical protein